MTEWITRQQAATIANCSLQTIDARRYDGTLPYQKFGRLVRIRKTDLEAMLNPPREHQRTAA
jgi:excisionase family DNA binding protein